MGKLWLPSKPWLWVPRALGIRSELGVSGRWYPWCGAGGETDCTHCNDNKMPAAFRVVFGGEIADKGCGSCADLLGIYDLTLQPYVCTRRYDGIPGVCDIGVVALGTNDDPGELVIQWQRADFYPYVSWIQWYGSGNVPCGTLSDQDVPFFWQRDTWLADYCDASGVTCTVSVL